MRKALPGVVLRAVCFNLAIFMMMSGDRVDAMDSDSSRDGIDCGGGGVVNLCALFLLSRWMPANHTPPFCVDS